MIAVYAHLRPDQFPFSNEFNHSDYVYTDLPEYANISIKQTEQLIKTAPILITNDLVNNEFPNEIKDFFDICKQKFPSFYKDPFWFLTLARLYVVFLYCKKNNIQEFIHLEYDNLIYSDLKMFKALPQSVYFTRVGPFSSSAGFMYCNSLTHFAKFIDKIKQLITKGEKVVRSFTQYDHLSEMIMIDLIHTHTKDVMDYLPILPFANYNDNFDKLNVLFDGASYGQYLGGTNNGHSSGWYGLHHYVGTEIAKQSIKILFDEEKRSPYLLYNEQKIPIMNLHIHCKKLQDFTL